MVNKETIAKINSLSQESEKLESAIVDIRQLANMLLAGEFETFEVEFKIKKKIFDQKDTPTQNEGGVNPEAIEQLKRLHPDITFIDVESLPMNEEGIIQLPHFNQNMMMPSSLKDIETLHKTFKVTIGPEDTDGIKMLNILLLSAKERENQLNIKMQSLIKQLHVG